MLDIGSDLGDYELISNLKSGGMATLYLGRRKDPSDARIFAIKVVHSHFLDDEHLVQMFQDEAGLSVLIEHRNVVRVEAVGAHKGRHFLVMEYIHGCSVAQLLQALIRRGRSLAPDLAVYIAMNVASGLHAAHQTRGPEGHLLNVVHRDVSPQNILLSHAGDTRLIDFGIAKSRMRVQHSLTGTAIRGKLRYMAPEHATGKGVDHRTDIYSLAIVLWEMLTMMPLFWAKSDFKVLDMVRNPKPEPPSRFSSGLPASLDAVVMGALSVDINKRPATAEEFGRQLAQALPAANRITERHLAALLHAVLGEEIKKDLEALPQELSRAIDSEGETGNAATEAIDHLTMPATEGELGGGGLAESFENVPFDGTAEDKDLVFDVDVVVQPKPPAGVYDDIDDATELMSAEAVKEIHKQLGKIESGSNKPPTPAHDESSRFAGDLRAGGDPETQTTPHMTKAQLALEAMGEPSKFSELLPIIMGVFVALLLGAVVFALTSF